ncbi:unnamed protein product [Orchesella dallaii]|uniref:Uncharacterized protein n=1 Tax=Orchesella dallaii TaxID=48710 RepID=A0ABP1Q8V2_9HEXA
MEGYYASEAVISAISDLQYQMQVVTGFLSWNFPDYARLRTAMDQQHTLPSMFPNHHMPHYTNIIPQNLGGPMKLPPGYLEGQHVLTRLNGSAIRIGKRQPATKKTNGEPLKRRGRKRKYPLAPVNTNIDISCEKIVLPHNSATYYRHHTTTSLGNEVSVLMPVGHGGTPTPGSSITTNMNNANPQTPGLKDSTVGPQELNRLELLATACFYAKPNELKSENVNNIPPTASFSDTANTEVQQGHDQHQQCFNSNQLHLENVESCEDSRSGSVESNHFHNHQLQQEQTDLGGCYLNPSLNDVNGLQMQEHHDGHQHHYQHTSLTSEEVRASNDTKSSFMELESMQAEQDECDIATNIPEQEVIVYST